MIALRARRQALRIASEMAHPHADDEPLRALAVHAPPDEPSQVLDPQGRTALEELVSATVIIAVSVGGFVLIWYRLYWPH